MSNFRKLPSGVVFDLGQVFAYHRTQSNGYLISSGQNHVAITAGDAAALDKYFASLPPASVVVIEKVDHTPPNDDEAVVDGDVPGPAAGKPVS